MVWGLASPFSNFQAVANFRIPFLDSLQRTNLKVGNGWGGQSPYVVRSPRRMNEACPTECPHFLNVPPVSSSVTLAWGPCLLACVSPYSACPESAAGARYNHLGPRAPASCVHTVRQSASAFVAPLLPVCGVPEAEKCQGRGPGGYQLSGGSHQEL